MLFNELQENQRFHGSFTELKNIVKNQCVKSDGDEQCFSAAITPTLLILDILTDVKYELSDKKYKFNFVVDDSDKFNIHIKYTYFYPGNKNVWYKSLSNILFKINEFIAVSVFGFEKFGLDRRFEEDRNTSIIEAFHHFVPSLNKYFKGCIYWCVNRLNNYANFSTLLMVDKLEIIKSEEDINGNGIGEFIIHLKHVKKEHIYFSIDCKDKFKF